MTRREALEVKDKQARMEELRQEWEIGSCCSDNTESSKKKRRNDSKLQIFSGILEQFCSSVFTIWANLLKCNFIEYNSYKVA